MLPILDNHMHLNPNGKCIKAVKEFSRSGGTHIVLVSLPSFSLGIKISKPKDFTQVFEKTVKIAHYVEKHTDVKVFTVLGVHPAEIDRLYSGMGIEQCIEVMKKGLEIASKYVVNGMAVGLKSGRPHYKVENKIWNASNEIMQYGFELAKDIGCAIQLHTETLTQQSINEIAEMAKKAGIASYKIIKHFSSPDINLFENKLFPSVLASKNSIKMALSKGTRFMMETDYIDDLKRPGSVLGPRSVPRRTKELMSEFGEDVFWKIHKENPEKVYEVVM